MKKFFSLVLALVMALSLTTVAWGADTLPTAENGVIKLTEDVTLTATHTFTESVTLDLNGKTIKGPESAWALVVGDDSNTCTLTLTDTSADANGSINGYRGIKVVKGSSLIMEKGNIVTTERGIQVYGSSATMNGGTIDASNGTNAVEMYGDDTAAGTFTMTGGKLVGNNAAILAHGSYNNSNATISGGVIENPEHTAIYWPSKGTLTISGGTITGKDSGIAIKAGTLNITGGSVICTGEDSSPTEGHSSGVNASGAAIQIESNNDYAGNIKVNITGGEIKSTNATKPGAAIYEYVEATTSDTAVSSVAVSGGDFTGKVMISSELAEDDAVVVSGGTFDTDVSDYVDDGYRLVNGSVSSVPTNTTGVVGGYEGMFTFAGATRQAITNLTKTPAVAPLDVDEDGYYNRAGDRLGAIEYYTLNLGGAVAQNYYRVNSVDDADLIVYAGDSQTPYMYLANEPAGGFTYLTGVAVFNNFGKACGQFKWATVDTTKTYYAYDGKVYVADPAGAVNLMIGGNFIQATDVTSNGTWVAHVPVYTQDKTGAVTAIKCANCTDTAVIVANYATLPNTVKAAGDYFNVPGSANKMFYWVDGAFVTPSTDKTVTSAETFDAGIAMYVGMSVMAAAGSAVVLKKRED